MIPPNTEPSWMHVAEHYGFAGIVALWFLFRTDQRLENLKAAFDALKEEIIRRLK